MPFVWLGAGALAVLGLKAGEGTADKAADLVKWLVVGFVLYLVAKQMRMI